MGPLRGLWRDTWYVWLGYLTMLLALSIFLSWFFLLALPALSVAFCYFAYIRYDENAQEKSEF
ncbi:hypothetical protein [Aporhodopirellula aestuarii]|uniref:Transmembrane protein n=1 Tax=Aporhodopirellula aestuarii TaxID=2950107 RepID=A0ABT0TXD2_9BACT|nr:hypothetical protein [Aporhodopirellula aestuarii]MCM2369272.1 hypothetical protein [Aporhodopirellula aestuarii]